MGSKVVGTDITIDRIIVENGARDFEKTNDILKRLNKLPIQEEGGEHKKKGKMPIDMDKRTLRLIPFRGEFLKPCPGTKGYICCGYQILNIGTNCPMDCSYCILQAYFNQPSLRLFINLDNELGSIGNVIDKNPDRIFRIGTGEFTDSLALDHITGWSRTLLQFFSKRKNSILELKTKSDRIEGLLSSSFRDRIIVSWSLNSPETASFEEHGAPSIRKRLLAAKRCQEEGFIIGLHFDPIIHSIDWKDGYRRTLELLDRFIDPGGIIWISLGCFRYMPPLKSIIRKRHPGTKILNGEFVSGLDGKMRYFKPIRIDIYSFLREQIEAWRRDSGIYLCMESDEVWEKSMGWSPRNSKGLSRYLDERVCAIYGN